jgi:hypothetical protein
MSVGSNAIALAQSWTAVRTQVDACSRQLRNCEIADDRVDWSNEEPQAVEAYEGECAYLGMLIEAAHLKMLVLIEQLCSSAFLEEYRKGFRRFRKKLDDVQRNRYDPEIHESEALLYVKRSFQTLSESREPAAHAHEIDAIAQIDGLLRSAHYIVGRAKIEPKSEAEVRRALLDYIRILYPDARPDVPIAHIEKAFKADIGIEQLGVLIEIKFVDSAREAKSEPPGFYEDMFGYRGDPRWTTHFALVYSTGPYIRQEELEAEFQIAECPVDWIPISVWGDGERTPKAAVAKATSRTPTKRRLRSAR